MRMLSSSSLTDPDVQFFRFRFFTGELRSRRYSDGQSGLPAEDDALGAQRSAVDMFVVATATFRLLYAVIVLGHDRRKIIHFDVTAHPTQHWLARQITEAFPWDTAPRYLLRDRDASYGKSLRDRIQAMGI